MSDIVEEGGYGCRYNCIAKCFCLPKCFGLFDFDDREGLHPQQYFPHCLDYIFIALINFGMST